MGLGIHPNIVRALEVHGYPPDQRTFILEYVNQSLRDVMAANIRLTLDEVLLIGIGIADGLTFAMRKIPGFVHGDLKPENVMVTNGWDREGDRSWAGARRRGCPQVGRAGRWYSRVQGSEQIKGRPAVPASDVYAIGCTIHEAVTGSPVFGHGIAAEHRHLNEQPVPLDPQRHGAPTALSALVSRCLAKNPKKRPSLS